MNIRERFYTCVQALPRSGIFLCGEVSPWSLEAEVSIPLAFPPA